MNETNTGSTGSNGQDPAASTGGTDSPADETFAWTAPGDGSAPPAGDPKAGAERMLGQLQSMIDTVATQAAPVVRQIGAKAAELAAIAADRAGPLAHKAADATADASVRLAEKSRTWAADLRTKAADAAGTTDADAASSASEAMGGADDPAEERARDEPAEGGRA